MRRDGLGKSRSVSNSATGPWRLALQGGDQKRAELARTREIERRSDARIPLFGRGRRAVLEHFLRPREGDGAERLDKQPAAQTSLKRFTLCGGAAEKIKLNF